VSDAGPVDEPDRVELQVSAMRALREDLADGGESPEAALVPEARTALAEVVSISPGVLAGLPVAREVFGRLGVRLRALVPEGSSIAAGTKVAEIGGPLRAMLAARPTAFRLLERLTAVASGALAPVQDDPLDRYAVGLRPPDTRPAGVGGSLFELEVLEVEG
jgi:nicotinate-nucleotide pyrophosphorylase